MMDNYLNILEESLKQKSQILDKITEYSGEQELLLKKEKLELEQFDALVDKKDALIRKLTELDEGFGTLYDRIKEQLQGNKEAYRIQIGRLQQLITQVTEKSISIQAQESRNKALVEQHFKGMRQEMKQGRRSSKAAMDYYKNMSRANVVMPQFMDEKN